MKRYVEEKIIPCLKYIRQIVIDQDCVKKLKES